MLHLQPQIGIYCNKYTKKPEEPIFEPLLQEPLDIQEEQLKDAPPDQENAIEHHQPLIIQEAPSENAIEDHQHLLIQEAPLEDDITSLNYQAGLYYAMGCYAEAEPLYLRALEILTNALPETHSDIQTVRDKLRHLIQQAIQQGQAATLSPHPTTQALLRELAP